MLSRAEEYRQRAKDCEEAAETLGNLGMQSLFQALGEQWLHLADDVELLDRKRNEQQLI
jgi:galactokinase